MKQEELIGKIGDNVNFTVDGLDTLRRDGLEDLKAFQRVKKNMLKKEQARLTKKLGPDHQRVAAVGTKIRYIDNMVKDLDVMITEANTETEPVDDNTWKVHGKIVDSDRKGIKDLTAALYDEKGRWQREIGYGCTNDQGYFSITFSIDQDTQPGISPDKKLFLYISDKNHNILYKDSEPLFVIPGEIIYKAIYISHESLECTPPEPGQGKPGPGQDQKEPEQKQTGPTPEKDQWVVEGKIKDEKNNPIKGIKVRLYDTENRFDDRLGSKVTNRSGKFKFIFKGDDFQALKEAEADIHLEVVDDTGQAVYTSPEPVRCEPGHVDVFDIQLPPRS